MAIFSLPIGDTVDTTYRLELQEVTYAFRFRWNDYDESWHCYVGLAGQDPVAKFKVNNGFNMLEQYDHLDAVPKGGLYCFDIITLYARPTKDDIGNDPGDRFNILYVESG